MNEDEEWSDQFTAITAEVSTIIGPLAQLTNETMMNLTLKKIMDPLYIRLYQQHKIASTPKQIQRMQANKAMGATAILAAWPKSKETTLDNWSFVHSVRTRIGFGLEQHLNLYQNQHQVPPLQPDCQACNKPHAKAVPEHLSSCPRIALKRHNEVVAMIHRMIEAAGVRSVVLEKDVGLGNNKRIDIWFRNPRPTNPLKPYFMVDPTIIQSFHANNTSAPNTTAKLTQAFNNKTTTYANAANQYAATLVPLPFTTFGAFHGEFTVFLKTMAKIGVATDAVDPEKTRDFAVQWKTNILFSIARATAKYAAQAAFWHNAVTSV